MIKARKGVYAAAITPLKADGTPDLGKLVRYCQRIVDEGLTGVALAGTTGEGNSMPMASRLDMPSVFRDTGFEADRVIFGTGACATDDAIALTRACTGAGYNNALVLPPFYFKNASEDGLFAYYARLIEGVGTSDLRIYLYHFPQMSMTSIPLTLIERLKRDYGPVIAGLKDSSGDYEGTLKFARVADDFDVFPSSEEVLCKSMTEGCAGAISATVNALPALAGKTLAERAEVDQSALADLRQIISKLPLSAALKQIESWKLSDATWEEVMPPLVKLTDDKKTELRALLKAFAERTGEHVI